MKLYSYIIVNLILSVIVIAISAGPASAECRDKSCMTDEYTFQDDQGAKHTFFYNSVRICCHGHGIALKEQENQ